MGHHQQPLIVALSAILTLGLAATASAQSTQDHPGQYTQADIEAGTRVYTAVRAVPWPERRSGVGIDLRRGSSAARPSDEDLARVITNGIPGTGMPPFTLQPRGD